MRTVELEIRITSLRLDYFLVFSDILVRVQCKLRGEEFESCELHYNQI